MLPSPLGLVLAAISLTTLSLMSCDPKSNQDHDGRQESDADTDADSDSDTDADADTDADLSSFAGTVTWSYSEGSTTACAGVVAITGTEFTGVCPDCDFAFSTDGVIESGDIPIDCGMSPLLSLVESGSGYRDMRIGQSNEMRWQGETYTDVFMVGIDSEYEEYDYGHGDTAYAHPDTAAPPPGNAIWIPIAGSGLTWDSSFTHAGDDISWNISYGWSEYDSNYQDYCGSYYYYYGYEDDRPARGYGAYPEGTTNYGGDFSNLSELDCGEYYTGYDDGGYDGDDGPPEPYSYGWWSDGELIDVWQLDTVAGETVSISIDTTDPGTAFDPSFWLNDGESCTVARAWSSFVCTWPVDDGGYEDCPSIKFDTPGGTWQVVVMSEGACAGEISEYEIRVDAPTDPNLRLLADNSDRYSMIDHLWTITGQGTITP